MRFRKAVLAVVIAGTGLLACSKSTEPEVNGYQYPLAAGNQWTYKLENISDYHSGKPNDTLTATAVVTSLGEIVLRGGVPAFRFQSEVVYDDQFHDAYVGENYYQNRDSGLYLLATCADSWETMPKRPSARMPVEVFGRTWSVLPALGLDQMGDSISCDGRVNVRQEPLFALKYPPDSGVVWRAFSSPAFSLDKTITGTTEITTAAGTFNCFRVRYDYDVEGGAEIFDDVADVGLVRRTMVFYDIGITGHDCQFGCDTVDYYTTWTLESFTLLE